VSELNFHDIISPTPPVSVRAPEVEESDDEEPEAVSFEDSLVKVEEKVEASTKGKEGDGPEFEVTPGIDPLKDMLALTTTYVGTLREESMVGITNVVEKVIYNKKMKKPLDLLSDMAVNMVDVLANAKVDCLTPGIIHLMPKEAWRAIQKVVCK